MKSIYTFIMEFRGGTYISQVKSISLEESMEDWINKIEKERKQIYQLGLKSIEDIKEQLLGEDPYESPVLLNGLVNVWHFTVSTRNGFGYVNIVKTEKE